MKFKATLKYFLLSLLSFITVFLLFSAAPKQISAHEPAVTSADKCPTDHSAERVEAFIWICRDLKDVYVYAIPVLQTIQEFQNRQFRTINLQISNGKKKPIEAGGCYVIGERDSSWDGHPAELKIDESQIPAFQG